MITKTFGNDKLTHLTQYELNGSVKEIVEREYFAFNWSGKIFLDATLPKEDLLEKLTLWFDDTGTLIKRHREHFSAESRYHYISIYEKKGIENNFSSLSNNERRNEKIFIYDSLGRKREYISVNKENKITHRFIYEYEETSNLPKRVFYYNENQKLDSISDYIYNEEGFNTEIIVIDADGSIKSKEIFVYNQKGHKIKYTKYDAEGKVTYESDSSKNYDKEGNPIKREINQEVLDLFFIQKELDHHGNCVKLVIFYKDQPIKAFVRSIVYYGEDEKQQDETILNLINTTQKVNFSLLLKNPIVEPLDKTYYYEANFILSENNTDINLKSLKNIVEKSTASEFAYLTYYAIAFNETPSPVSYKYCTVDALGLLNRLKNEFEIEIVNIKYLFNPNNTKEITSYTVVFNEYPGYLVFAHRISPVPATDYDESEFDKDIEVVDGCLHTGDIELLRPSEESGLVLRFEFEHTFTLLIEASMVYEAEEQPEIYMVEMANGNYCLKSYPVKDDFEIDDLDIHYGYGFRKFHEELMERLETESKGLILFHGRPGTGKTYYIRHLLREIALGDNLVIYMPPNMVDYLVHPAFMTFLVKTVANYNSQHKNCILLIEDAEPLLVAREADTRIQGITNLLNMTDGLLNDMLKMQIICTFNVDIKHLDPALLRPGRLLARKEFKALPELEANLLAQELGIDHQFTQPVTLSEIFAMLDNKNTIIHDEY